MVIELQIYYAHHIWKYGTKIEEYELDLIKRMFPKAQIFNPSTDIDQTLTEEKIMECCLDAVRKSNMIIFSSMDGCIGRGVYQEIECAYSHNINVSYLFTNQIREYDKKKFKQAVILNGGVTPRIYAVII